MKNTGKQIFLGGIVCIVFGIVWDQLTPLPFFLCGLGVISLVIGTVYWIVSRSSQSPVNSTADRADLINLAFAYWGLGLTAFAAWGVCHFLPGFSFAHILPEHLRESTAIKILFFIGLMWIVLGAGFFIHFCWFAARAIRIEGKVTSFATQTEKGREMYAEVVTYYLGDKPRTVTGAVWTPFMPATLHKMRTVWVNRDNWDKAVMYSPFIFFISGLFLMLGLVVCAVIFTIA